MRIHYLQHVPFEDPGSILIWANKNSYPVTCTRLYEDETLPNQHEFDWLFIMGGPMNIYEEDKYSWLIHEKSFIKKSIENNKVVIGLCLGGQLIADVIGGKVVKNSHKEIGWFPVKMNKQVLTYPQFSFFPEKPVVFEWHGDSFVDLPLETILIAGNEICNNQAFLYKSRVYGFQFHLENTMESIQRLIENCSDELISDFYVQTVDELLSHTEYIRQDNNWMNMFLSSLASLDEKGEL